MAVRAKTLSDYEEERNRQARVSITVPTHSPTRGKPRRPPEHSAPRSFALTIRKHTSHRRHHPCRPSHYPRVRLRRPRALPRCRHGHIPHRPLSAAASRSPQRASHSTPPPPNTPPPPDARPPPTLRSPATATPCAASPTPAVRLPTHAPTDARRRPSQRPDSASLHAMQILPPPDTPSATAANHATPPPPPPPIRTAAPPPVFLKGVPHPTKKGQTSRPLYSAPGGDM